MTKTSFKNFDFQLLEKKEFKEDSVREEIIAPLLRKLGFSAGGDFNIIRSKKLMTPFVTIGSKKRKINHYPDYLLSKNKKHLLILDAKAPQENILRGKNVEQAYFYCIHPDIRCDKYALCNGYTWTFFQLKDKKPSLVVETKNIENELEKIRFFIFDSLSVEEKVEEKKYRQLKKPDAWYLNKSLPEVLDKPKKQGTRRHFGVHGYFTKQSWDIVDKYIQHFTQEGDMVLDPFGGSGVTLIEALMNGRGAIHIDLNPLSVFWMETLLSEVDLYELKQQGLKIIETFKRGIKQTTLKDVKDALPENLPLLSKGADVKKLHQIFSKEQLKELGYLKKLILKVRDKTIRKNLMLAFSSTLTKNNLTYHTSKLMASNPYGGNSGIFMYYRYRLSKNPVNIDLKKSFLKKVEYLIKAKKEIEDIHLSNPLFQIYRGDATDLKIRLNDSIKPQVIKSESIDYIYTDPPYGKKIEYLDLSVMWNAWLGLKVSNDDYNREAIEGGHMNKSKQEYSDMIIRSLKEMFRVLKWNRWMSFVFQHQDKDYWYLIVENAEKIGFEYKGAVRQNNGQTSFKKRQNPFSVLSGQLIVNFIKKKDPNSILKANLGGDITVFILNNIESVIAEKDGATINEINDSLVINALEMGFLDKLSEYGDITPYLQENFEYDQENSNYHLRPQSTFKSYIPLDKRIEYFLISYLRRNNRDNKYPDFSDIVYDIMPLLKNGRIPESQTIKKVLDNIAIVDEKLGGYVLKESDKNKQQLRLL